MVTKKKVVGTTKAKPKAKRKDKKKELILKTKDKVRAEYYLKFVEKADNVGSWNLKINELSKEWGIPTTTLSRWRDNYINLKPKIDPILIGENMMDALTTSIKKCQDKIHNDHWDNQTQIKYMHALANLSDKLTTIMERYFVKPVDNTSTVSEDNVITVTVVDHNKS